jgi:hypothetical protein
MSFVVYQTLGATILVDGLTTPTQDGTTECLPSSLRIKYATKHQPSEEKVQLLLSKKAFFDNGIPPTPILTLKSIFART